MGDYEDAYFDAGEKLQLNEKTSRIESLIAAMLEYVDSDDVDGVVEVLETLEDSVQEMRRLVNGITERM